MKRFKLRTVAGAEIEFEISQAAASEVLYLDKTTGKIKSVDSTTLGGGEAVDWGALTEDLIPDGSIDIGATGSEIANIFVDKIFGAENCGSRSIDVTQGLLIDASAADSVDWTQRNLKLGSDVVASWASGALAMGGTQGVMPVGTANPVSPAPVAGSFYFNTADDEFCIYNGSGWVTVALT